jgi:hypothetical protein
VDYSTFQGAIGGKALLETVRSHPKQAEALRKSNGKAGWISARDVRAFYSTQEVSQLYRDACLVQIQTVACGLHLALLVSQLLGGRPVVDIRRPAGPLLRVLALPQGTPPQAAPASRLLVDDQASRKKQLRVGAARWLCSRPGPERSSCLDRYGRAPLGSSRCADLPPPTRAASQRDRREGSKSCPDALAGSAHDDAAGRTVGPRAYDVGGFAQSCGPRRSFDRGRSDLCSRHQQASCGRFARVSADPALCSQNASGRPRPFAWPPGIYSI